MVRFLVAFVVALCGVFGSARAETYRLRYEAVILGVVTLGEATYNVTANASRYAARATLRTSGAAWIFDQTNISAAATGAISGETLNWTRYDLSHAYANKFRRVALSHNGGAVTAEIRPSFGSHMGDPPATPAQASASYDPLTGLFALGRQVGAAHVCRGSVLVFDGRGHYRLTLRPRGAQTSFHGGGYDGPALVCSLRFQPIAGFSMSAAERAHIPEGEALFALTGRPGFAPVLRLTVPTPVGAAQLDLRGYEQR